MGGYNEKCALACGALLVAACSGPVDSESGGAVVDTSEALHFDLNPNAPAAKAGHVLFEKALPHTNRRACATCHVDKNHFVLLPSDVQARLASNPKDPLFNAIDADDSNAAKPTYEHLKVGLVRIVLKLPDNMDLINEDGSRVTTPPDRTFFVWRGVPTVENTSFTAPYQYDGRFATFQIQAQGAITSHSQGPQEPKTLLDLIATFENTVYSSDRAKSVAEQIAAGSPKDQLQNPEDGDTSNGNRVYVTACKPCHGGATDNTVTNRDMVDKGFNLFSRYALTGGATTISGGGPVVLKPDGNVLFKNVPDPTDSTKTIIVSTSNPQANDDFMNLGFAGLSSVEQQGIFIPLGPDGANPHVFVNQSVPLPHYRFRFYTDGTRTTAVTDLPPIPASTGLPCNGALCGPFNPPFDANGLPIVGPNFFMQSFSTDPGRAGITGNPADFEAFDVPQLRGIANTAPYFHDNSVGTLADVIDLYSRFILPFIAATNLPPVNPPEGPELPPEALSKQDKADLLKFLQTF